MKRWEPCTIVPTLDLERSLTAQGYNFVVRFDEVGRGVLTDPVMAGCTVIWIRDLGPLDGDDAVKLSGRAYPDVPGGMADSKISTEHGREVILDELRDRCTTYAVDQVNNTEIDEWGITHALSVAVLRAFNQVRRESGLQFGGGLTVGETTGEPAGKIMEDRPGGSVGESIEDYEGSTHALPKAAGILDRPNDYTIKIPDTFDAPDVSILADITTEVEGGRHHATVTITAVIVKVTQDRLMVDLA